MIPFNKPCFIGKKIRHIKQSINSNHIAGDGIFSQKCHQWFCDELKVKKTLLTPSCTHALEMTALLANIQKGDEVIMPSFTFVSTANAFVLRGAKIVFVDIDPNTMNIDENKIQQAITKKTKAIVVVHYAGVSCEMDEILNIAKKYKLFVIEDAAQAIRSFYKDRPLGSMGDFGAFSFHETKNITSGGEGGLLSINKDNFIKKAEIIREKGTNRSKFFRGEVNKYEWIDKGSSYLLNDISAAYLYTQLENIDKIIKKRLKSWEYYFENLKMLDQKEYIILPFVPLHVRHNGHIFYIKVKNLKTRTKLIEYLKQKQIHAVFHYLPLHSSNGGKKFGEFVGKDVYTTKESQRLLRLPMFYSLKKSEQERVVSAMEDFCKKHG